MLEVAQVNFIGRKEELNTLEKEFRRDGSFVVIYGRRRIGKTTLIKEFIKDKQAFYFLATEEVESQSMKRLASMEFPVTRATTPARRFMLWDSTSSVARK